MQKSATHTTRIGNFSEFSSLYASVTVPALRMSYEMTIPFEAASPVPPAASPPVLALPEGTVLVMGGDCPASWNLARASITHSNLMEIGVVC